MWCLRIRRLQYLETLWASITAKLVALSKLVLPFEPHVSETLIVHSLKPRMFTVQP